MRGSGGACVQIPSVVSGGESDPDPFSQDIFRQLSLAVDQESERMATEERNAIREEAMRLATGTEST